MNGPITALMVSTSYPASSEDWKGIFIRNLCNALAARFDLNLELWAPPGDIHTAINPATTLRESAWLGELMHKGGIAHLLRTSKGVAFISTVKLLMMLRSAFKRSESVDLYHVNWLQNALPLPANRKPLIVSVLGTDMQLLKLPMMRAMLRRVFNNHPTVICPNADWMVPILKSQFSEVAKVTFVPFGIDPMWYAITRDCQTRGPARWLAVTRITRDKLGPLFDWCAPLFDGQQRELHLFGPMQESIKLPAWVHYHGPATPETLCKTWFPTAQGFITLSCHAEGRPQVLLEAMAAGLPIIASRIPAHEDLILHNETGWLCGKPEGLSEGVKILETWSDNHRIGNAARNWASREIGTWEDCAAHYVSLYHKLLEDKQHA